MSKNGEKFPVEVYVSSFVVDEDIHYAAILRDMSQPGKTSTSSIVGRQTGDKEIRIKKKVTYCKTHLCKACMCNIHWIVGITCRSNNEIYTQVNKPRVYYKGNHMYVCNTCTRENLEG